MRKTTKPRRPDYLPGHYYHIYNRGASRTSIFLEPDNYIFVIRKMKKYSQELNLSLIVYCLMPNHYHFLIRQNGEQAAGLLPQRVFNSYSKAYNKRFERTAHYLKALIKSSRAKRKVICFICAATFTLTQSRMGWWPN